MEKLKNIAPGVALCFLIILLGSFLTEMLGRFLIAIHILPEGSKSPVSAVFIAILIGIIIRHTIPLPAFFKDGISFSLKRILRVGIVLLGLRLSLIEALKLGAIGIPLIVACIASGLFVTLYFTKKLQQSRRLGTLIACGTGICGVTAIMATSPVIKAKDDEISYAVANVTMFGLIGMLFYPYLSNLFFADDPVKAGLFLGTAIHDTAQVTGAALMYDQLFDEGKVVDVATVTKLTRNLFIIAVIPFVSYLFFSRAQKEGKHAPQQPKWYTFIPLFVIGFLFMSFIRTLGDMTIVSSDAAFGFIGPLLWQAIHENVSTFGSTYLLGTAMAAVGLSTNFKAFKGIGMKPFYIGFIAAITIGLVSFLLISLFGSWIDI